MRPRPAPGGGATAPAGESERPSIRRLFASRFVALILGYQVLSALGSQLSDYLVYDRAGAQFTDPADLARFLAGYTAAINVASIAFLFLLAGPLLRRFGLRLGITANPFVLGGVRGRDARRPRRGGRRLDGPAAHGLARPGSPTSR